MKELLLSSMFIFCTFFGFSQAYKLDERRTYYLNVNTELWEQDQLQIYSYANGGIKETKITVTDFSTSEEYYQIEKYYNNNNDIILMENQEWDPNIEDWSVFSEVVYYYDPANKLLSETTRIYDHNTSTYLNEARFTYEYPSPSLIIKILQEWDASINDWLDEEKVEMTYTNDLLTEKITSNWSSLDSQWYLQYKDTLLYDTNNLLIEWRYEDYSFVDEEWQLEDRDLLTYSGTLLIEVLHQSLVNSNWRDDEKLIYYYDVHGNVTRLTYEQRDSNTDELEPYYKEEMEYSLADPFLNVGEVIVDNFKLYPNPVTEYLNLDFDSALPTNYEVQLFTMDGKLVQTEKLTSGKQKFQLYLANLQKGMYLLTIKGNQNLSYKILKN